MFVFQLYKTCYVGSCLLQDKILDINYWGTTPRRRRFVQALRNVNSYLLHEVQQHNEFGTWWKTLMGEYQNVYNTNVAEIQKCIEEKLSQ